MRPARAGLLAGLLAASCGGSPAGPSAASAGAEAGPRHALSGLVFYDENGNGLADAEEGVRFPGVTVRLGDRSAVTDASGRFGLEDAATGARCEPDEATLPPFFQAGRVVVVPGGAAQDLAVPVALPIGGNRPHVYMGFGDSITAGVGSHGERGYLPPLADLLSARFGRAEMAAEAQVGTRSDQGAARLADALARVRPAYTLIDYGTNDYAHACRQSASSCPTLASLREMVRATRAAGSLPVVATLLPGNPIDPDPLSAARDAWVSATNEQVRAMAREEGVPVADVWAAFEAEPRPERLFTDYLHPNDRGYDLMAQAFFDAIAVRR